MKWSTAYYWLKQVGTQAMLAGLFTSAIQQSPAASANGSQDPASLLQTGPVTECAKDSVPLSKSCHPRVQAGSVRHVKKQPARSGRATFLRPGKLIEHLDPAAVDAFQHHWRAMNAFIQKHVARLKDDRVPVSVRLGVDPSRMLADDVFSDVRQVMVHLEALRTIMSKPQAEQPC